MKRFDQESIKERMLSRLRVSEDWAMILHDGTAGSLISTIAEGFSELARYLEFALNEKKWRSAMNVSSLMHMAELISYKRQLPQSAIGYIVVSHTDAEGADRLGNLGKYFFDLDAASNYDNIEKSQSSSLSERKALVPWTSSLSYTVPQGTRFLSDTGIEFFATESVSSKCLTKGFSIITSDSSLKEAFIKNGGWKGIKYLKVPVMQGIQRSVSVGRTHRKRFECFKLETTSVDRASTSVTRQFFKVRIVKKADDSNTVTEEIWEEIDKINRAGPLDKVFEKKISQDGTGIIIKFGNDIAGRIPPSDAEVFVDYVETKGYKGNISAKYSVNKMIFPSGYSMVDPRTNTISSFLSCTNNVSISGGKDIDSIENIRSDAPLSYLQSYTIATKEKYGYEIERNSPINILHWNLWDASSNTVKQLNSVVGLNTEDKLSDKVFVSGSIVNLSIIDATGSAPDEDTMNESVLPSIFSALQKISPPSESLCYKKANVVTVTPLARIKTSDITTSESDIKNYVKSAISMSYDVSNQKFNSPIYSSKIIHDIKAISLVDSVSIMLEANAYYDYENAYLIPKDFNSLASQSDFLVAIPFEFSNIFMKSPIAAGFEDYKSQANYLLRVDLSFKNSANFDNDRTFFLIDHRKETDGEAIDSQTAKEYFVNDEKAFIKKQIIDTVSNDTITMFRETDDNFRQRQVRIAQFPKITDITDAKFFSILESQTAEPSEIRPLVQSIDGKNLMFSSIYVNKELRSSLNGEAEAGAICYKKDLRWIDDVDIIFHESSSDDSLFGTIYLPLDYLKFDESDIDVSLYSSAEDNIQLSYQLSSLLKQYIGLRIAAVPKEKDISTYDEADFVYLDSDTMAVTIDR